MRNFAACDQIMMKLSMVVRHTKQGVLRTKIVMCDQR